ncbi:glycosyltransferase family 4 protein [Listeria grandensis]|uniref:Glycosyltransferase family 4 protein n=1 Tax=Listeria grandensis TaxID=1494963 RepID=A0A7X0Y4V3_9LIST|nr:glycosyltransferase family 4 protein [Listeria grandensis]MBC1936813.1 glycosyltransferase family 4 protein [Listeria grandensis]
MNILMVGPDSHEKGGIATVIANFQQHYSSEKHQLFFLSSWSNKNKYQTEWRAVRSIRQIIRAKQIDIVHFHVAQKGSFFRKALLSKLVPKRCRVIFHMHASQFDLFYKKARQPLQALIRSTFNQIDHVVVLGENWATFYQTLTDTKVSIIQNAVQVPKSPLYDEKAQTIVTFGRIGKRKGSYDLLQVAARIEPFFPKVKFVLYGDGDVEKVNNQIRTMGLRNVNLGGWVSKEEQAEILKGTLLHFLPSYHEGLPMAILETMAAGVPNLTTDVGDISELIENDVNGIMTSPGDVEMMTDEISSFIRNDDNRRSKYSQNAFRTIESEFSIATYMVRWEAVYESL